MLGLVLDWAELVLVNGKLRRDSAALVLGRPGFVVLLFDSTLHIATFEFVLKI